MGTTDTPMSLDEAVNSIWDDQSEEPETETEEAEEDQTDEAPDAELDDEEEVEAETDDADDGETVEDEDEDDTDDAGREELVAVKVDGEEVQVTLEDLKRSYSGQRYIQQGMQEAAAKKKEAEQIFQQLQQEREQFSQLVQSVQQSGFAQEPTPPDQQLLEADPIGYMQQKAAYDQAKAQYDQQKQQIQHYQSQQTEAQRQAMQAYAREQAKLLREAIPELADPDKGGRIKTELVSTGREYGFSEDEISQALDHRALVVLNDARKWRQLQKSKASKRTDKTRPAVKPKAKQKQEPSKIRREKQMQRFRKTGRLEDAVDLMFEQGD